jgi:hypothetical protein
LLTNRFPRLLTVALLLTTLAPADSIHVAAASMYSGASAYGHAPTFARQPTLNAAKAAPTMFAAYSHVSTGANGEAHIGGLISRTAMFSTGSRAPSLGFTDSQHGTISRKNGTWAVWRERTPLATPEPGSLMLLSTGLAGIAGMVRRKLLRG